MRQQYRSTKILKDEACYDDRKKITIPGAKGVGFLVT